MSDSTVELSRGLGGEELEETLVPAGLQILIMGLWAVHHARYRIVSINAGN